jgi:hypothetical protein
VYSSLVHFVPSSTISFRCNRRVLTVEVIDSENEDQSEVEVANGTKKPIGTGAARSILRTIALDLSKVRAERCNDSTRGSA